MRRSVQRRRRTSEPVLGGLWRVDKPEDQETELATLFYGLILLRRAEPQGRPDCLYSFSTFGAGRQLPLRQVTSIR